MSRVPKRTGRFQPIATAAITLGLYEKANENNLLAERLSTQQESWLSASASAHNSASATSHIPGAEDTTEAALVRAAGYLERDPGLCGNLVQSLIDLSSYQVRRGALNRAAKTLTRAVGKADGASPLLRWEAEVRAASAHRLVDASAPVQLAARPNVREADPAVVRAQNLLAALRPGEQPTRSDRASLIGLLSSNPRHPADRHVRWYYQELGGDPEEPTALNEAPMPPTAYPQT